MGRFVDRIGRAWEASIRDVALIVISILIAFGLQAWWEGRALSAAYERQLVSVLAEIEEARDELVHWSANRSRTERNTAALADLLAATPTGTSLVVDDTVVASLLSTVVTELPTAQVDALLAGGYPAMNAGPLRAELIALKAMIEDYRDDETVARDYILGEVAPYMRENFDVAAAQLAWYDWLVAGGAPTGRTEIESTRHLRNLVAWKQRDTRLNSSQSSSLLEALESVGEQIRRELGR
jgi:hypothetical protein